MLELNFHPFPVLRTSRLMLKRITMADAEAIFQLRSNKESVKYLDRAPAESIADAEALIQKIEDGIVNNTAITWGITLKDQSWVIGTIGYHRIEYAHFNAEIGYMLMPEYWNKGYMSELIPAVTGFGFDAMNLHRIEACINPANSQSAHILKKHHFLKEAYFRESYFYDGRFIDSEIYSLLQADVQKKDITL